MKFEWDEAKRLTNIAKHGIDFLAASSAFDGRSFIDLRSAFPNELRVLRIVMMNGICLTIVWTLREDDVVRIISARRSRDEERRKYREIHG